MQKLKRWMKITGLKVIKAAANAVIISVGTATIIQEVNWKIVWSSAFLAGFIALLRSICEIPENNNVQ